MKFQTKAIRLAFNRDPHTEAVIGPVHLGTTFRFTGLETHGEFDYGRSGNPTRTALEKTLAGLENAAHGISFATGMAATDAILSTLLPGDEVVVAGNLYGGTTRLFESFYRPRGCNFITVKGDDPADFRAAITSKTKMVWLETPTNPQLQLLDIEAIAKAITGTGVSLIVDNTFASPFLQRPLELGADVVFHSTTKFISGHHDVLGGVVVTNDEKWAEKVRFYQNTAGAVPSPFDCYLILRGLKTLGLRMKQHCENSMAIAEYLETCPKVYNVMYPGLKSHPQHELAKRQMYGFGGMVTFSMDATPEQIGKFMATLDIFHYAESLGGAESLIAYPKAMSHAVLTEEERLAQGIDGKMIRVSPGLEDAEDLVEDFRRAFGAAFA